jgi:uncharacterized membrane protein YsdA (DUF1294 family)
MSIIFGQHGVHLCIGYQVFKHKNLQRQTFKLVLVNWVQIVEEVYYPFLKKK